MKRIVGKVLARESNSGIPDLVVSVFDSDLTIEDIRERQLSEPLLRRLGRRISSVLTDAEGRFSLSTENLEYPGNEARPDLLLLVLAPEDVQDIKRPYPLPAEERVLYVSTVPRVEAGAEEAYVIRLLQAQLDLFRIAAGVSGQDRDSSVRDLTSMRLRGFDLRDGVRDAMEKRLTAERQRIEAARTEARKKISQLSAVPRHLRDKKVSSQSLLITDKAALATDLRSMQAEAVSDALSRLAKRSTPPTLRLHLTEKEVRDLGLTIQGEKVSGVLTGAKLATQVRSLVNLTDLIRTRAFVPPPLEELERKYLSGVDNSNSPTAQPDT
jgi:hypothetical protein